MDLQKLTIGQMAELNHISEQTLRLYDRDGLLKPQYTDPSTGYRYYHILQSARLDMIQNFKVYGMTLRQIKGFLEDSNARQLQAILQAQEVQITEKIAQLQRSRAAIRRALENYKKYEAMPKNGEIFHEFIPERHIFSYSCDVNYFDQDESGYEYMLRQLKKHLAVQNIAQSYFSNIGTIIRRHHLLGGNLFSNEVFLFVDSAEPLPGVECLPAATYVCLCSDRLDHEEANVRRLLDYVREMDCEIAGDYICEVIVDFPQHESERREMCYKTQIPIKNFGNYNRLNKT